MINLLAGKWQKKIAWVMYFLFCSDIVVSAKMTLLNSSVHENRNYVKGYANTISENDPSPREESSMINKNSTNTANRTLEETKTFTKSKVVKGSIGGPGQPEMQSFQSVNANNLVDLFSGDFSYNIPLMDVGGYPIGLSYKSGITMDQEPSWVGLGWNINPGTISRNVRGLPDDFNGTEKIEKKINIKKSWTAGLSAGASPEIFGLQFLNLNVGATYNNYTGVGMNLGVSVDFKKMMGGKTTNATETKVDGNFTGGFSPSIGLSISSQQGMNLEASLAYKYNRLSAGEQGGASLSANYNSRSGLKDLQLASDMSFSKQNRKSLSFENTAEISFAKPTYTPSMTVPFTNFGFSLHIQAGGELFGFHPLVSLTGSYNQQYIANSDRAKSFPAYGYMYYQNSNNDRNALLDFNREKDIVYRTATPHLGIPIYTHDIYSISGEGIAGMFRPFRGDVGAVRDHRMKTKTGQGNLSLDLGVGNLTIVGGSLSLNYSTVENTAWTSNNFIAKNIKFGDSDTTHEAVYFRNPSEQTSNTSDFYSRLGNDDVVRVGLGGDKSNSYASSVFNRFDKNKSKGSIYVSKPLLKDQRDKRTQVISYLTAAEAKYLALDTVIKSYKINSFPKGKCDTGYEKITRDNGAGGLREPNHISEITVLNPDGKRYVYGIPAYNFTKKEVTFALDKSNDGDNNTGLVSYTPGSDNTPDNNRGKDHYFNSEVTPGYAHSYLLTALLSPDYVDLTGDGVTEDDIGDAIKFNYSKMKWSGDSSFKWRIPYYSNKATYNEGFKTDRTDDKGSYVYGEKEVWYMNSIESKSMITTFVLDTTTRQDAYEAASENGGRGSKSLKRLKEINLYSKADFIKNGTKARPIKTVHFAYSYSLCHGIPSNSSTGAGKLTLDSVWFTYNNNNRAIKNKYRFNYHQNNPDYNNKSYDRWGNYKPQTNNPGNIPNVDFPYVAENKDSANLNAGAWNLSQIVLPSGAKMNVDYESDDYAYVQNKRAADMFKVYGMATDNVLAHATPRLYTPGTLNDYRYVFISVPKAVTSDSDIRRLYLDGVDKIYFQMLVKMPSDGSGSGYERVPFFAEYENYGVASSNVIWIKLKEFGQYQSFPTIAALQMLKLNFPSKAYPGSDVSDNSAFKQVILALIGTMRQFSSALVGFSKSKRLEGVCSSFDSSRSFVRLNNPGFSKLGGGLRVKKITISDNWNKMTSQKEATYGQEYKYTIDTIVGMDTLHISSGVASYEPSIGNEENPFYLPIEYTEKVTLAPKEYFSSYYPLGESYFPSPSIGYSSVTVSSINKKNLKSFNGWEMTEFYTTKDFPTITDFTAFDGDSRKRWKLNLSVLAPVKLIRTTLSQGFKVELNDMNGKIKSQKSFAANDSVHPISYTYNTYKTKRDNVHGTTLSNTVPLMSGPSGLIDPNGTINEDIELLNDTREQESSGYGVTIPFNVDDFLAGIFPIIIPTFFPKFSYSDDRYRSMVTVKLIQRYGILDSVIHYEKGSLISTKNLVYDGETGEPIITRTQNEFNDPIYSFNYPSHWAYQGMSHAYKNIGAIFSNLCFRGGKIINKNIDNFLESGDEVAVSKDAVYLSSDTCRAADWTKSIHARRLWVVDINKAIAGSTTRNLFFIDKDGNPYYDSLVTIKIIRSGKRNLLRNSVGLFTCLKNPIDVINANQWQIKADSAIGVINTGAATFKDFWSVDNVFSPVHSCTGSVDPSCDSLTQILNGFRFNYGFPIDPRLAYNADGCDTSSYYFSYLPPGLKFKDMFTKPGVVSLPASVEDTIPRLSCVYYLNQARCINNLRGGFVWETRIKAPPTDDSHAQWKGTILMCQTDRGGLAYRTDYLYFGHDVYGKYNGDVVVDELNLNLTDWHTYKLDFRNDSIKVFFDDTLKWAISKPGYITTLYDYNDFFQYLKGQVDWVKIHDNYGNLVLSDDFNSGCTAFSLPKAINRCYSDDCQTSFVNYFNGKTHGNYTFSQIDSIYMENCRYFYNPCNDSITYAVDSCIAECKSIFTNRFNPYTQGMWGNWRMDKSYVFYDTRKQSNTDTATNIRRDGEIKKFVPYWNFNTDKLTASNYNKWVWNSEITRFNKKGVEVENKDPLGRYNSGLYGYNQTLPIAVAQNAKYRQIAFDGFEDYSFTNDSCGQSCPPARQIDWSGYSNQFSTAEKHSGKYSLRVDSGQSVSVNFNVVSKIHDTATASLLTRTHLTPCNRLDSIYASDENVATPVFSPIQGDSLLIGTWVKESRDCKCDSFVNNSVTIIFYDSSNTNIGSYNIKPSGSIIEGWQRYEEYITVPATAVKGNLALANTSSGASATNVFFDDLRIHPFNSNIKTYVYNAVNLRLMAELDENNYATFYEYDDEGTLVRVKKETQLGIKTITETRSTLLK